MSTDFDRHPYLKTPNCDPEEKKKLTFDEWYESNVGALPTHQQDGYNFLKRCWETAQDNKEN